MTTFYEDCEAMIGGMLCSLKEGNYNSVRESLIDMKKLMRAPYHTMPGDMDEGADRIVQIANPPAGLWVKFQAVNDQGHIVYRPALCVALIEQSDITRYVEVMSLKGNSRYEFHADSNDLDEYIHCGYVYLSEPPPEWTEGSK